MPRCPRQRIVYVPAPAVPVEPLWPWVSNIADRVAFRYALAGPQHLDDLTSAGYVRTLELLQAFRPAWPAGYADPAAAFRGWAYREVLTSIQREAARLLGGGTFHAPRRGAAAPALPVARPLSDLDDDLSRGRLVPETTAARPDPECDWEDDPDLWNPLAGTSWE